MRVNRLSSTKWVLLLVACWGIAGLYFAASDSGGYRDDLTPKVKMATEGVNGGRLLIVGGSNALTGLRAEVLSEVLKRPALNLALSGEGGDVRILWELLNAVARPGDVVLLSMRGFITDYQKDALAAAQNDHTLAKLLGSKYLQTQPSIPWWKPFPAISLARRLKKLIGAADPVYPAQKMNSYGDVSMSCQIQPIIGKVQPLPFSVQGPEYWRLVAGHVARLHLKGVTVWSVFPRFLDPSPSEQILQVLRDTESQLLAIGVNTLDPSPDSAFLSNQDLFCDSAHLSPLGAAKRTNEVADLLIHRLGAEHGN